MHLPPHLPETPWSWTAWRGPRRDWLRLCAATGLGAATVARAAPEAVWIVHAEGAPAHTSAQRLRAALLKSRPGLSVLTAPWTELSGKGETPTLVIAIGPDAARAMLQTPAPVLATLLTRAEYQAIADPSRTRTSAVWLDQAPERMVALARVVLPGFPQLAVLSSPISRDRWPELRRAAQRLQLRLRTYESDATQIAARLGEALEDADALLGLPDAVIYNGDTLRFILAASYRRNVPLLSFSPAYVRAGALCALYATPQHISEQVAAAVNTYLALQRWPVPSGPRDFEVDVNRSVARSFGLVLDDDAELKRRVAQLLDAGGQTP